MSKFHKDPNYYIGTVCLKVMDLNQSIVFYEKILGFKVLEKNNVMAKLTVDGKTPLVILEQPEGIKRKSKRTSGLYHFALLLPNRKDLAEFIKHLLNIRYPFGTADHLVSEAIYLNDLDGNGIEVYVDRPSDQWKWKNRLVHMDTLELDLHDLLKESEQPWTHLPKETIMGHIHLHVSHLDEAKTFYTEGLGYHIVSTYPQAYFLSTGGYHHHIAINTWQGVGVPSPSENDVGLNWYEIIFPNEKTLQLQVEKLRQIGATVTKDGDYFVTEDPAGNRIRLVVR
ncbi:VOC family protein [Fervidibacillus halotolerans]|uniref:VOC family protein n=1 Tax=Fervidibacillus halotolerans TaxID=2980027 RepID=A0A9E8LXX1_9BACI|nr:VOC family protein [Fervidibacillus halotolerans]WAA11712.1 VOC family protein [Fervidibacillus halotolerans]